MCKKLFLSLCLLLSFVSSVYVHAYTYLYSHGFGGIGLRYHWYKQKNNRFTKLLFGQHYIFCNDNIKVVKFNDAKFGFIPCYLPNSCLGQDADIAVLSNGYDEVDDEDIILFGVSRGAATASNFVARHNPERIKALILESPFDYAERGIDGFLNIFRLNRLPRSKNFCKSVFYRFSSYDQDGIHPRDIVENINPDLPVLLVCSKEDIVIPYQSTVNLYQQLIETGHEHVYLLVLDRGWHARLLWSADGERYQNVVHAFYRRYGLPHDADFAERGQADFERCRPSIQELQEEKNVTHKELKDTLEEVHVREHRANILSKLSMPFKMVYATIKNSIEYIKTKLRS